MNTPTPRTIPETYNITFHCGQASQEIMRLDEDGMTYKGQRIEDGGEAHRAFLEVMSAMQPTPRTDTEITFTGAYTCTHHNDQQRADCPVCVVAKLRAEVERLKKQIKDDNRSYGCELRDPYGTIWEQATTDHARAERAEAAETVALAHWNKELERAMKAEAERDHLHAQLRALTLICGTNDANKFETWIDRANARAERAEAEVERLKADGAASAFIDMSCRASHAEAELAKERARLNWLETPSGMDWQWEPERLTVSRASIDAAMTEDAK